MSAAWAPRWRQWPRPGIVFPLLTPLTMFGIENYGGFVAAVIVFLMIPGPGNLALVHSTAKGGVAAGLGATFGVIAGDQVLMWLAVAGVAALLQSHPSAFAAVQWLGAVYLAWLGIQMLLAKPGAAPVLMIRPRHFFAQAFWITLLNPKAILFYMAFFPLFVDPVQQPTFSTFAVMALTVAVLTFGYGLAMVLLTRRLAERMRASPRIGWWLQKIAGVFLVGFGVKLALSR